MAGYSSHNLEAFVDAVRLKSFSAVARKRGITPSSVARQVSSLEEELGVALFLRSTRSLVPTEAGRLLYERSLRILDDLDDAKRAATSLRKDVRGVVRLCCWPTLAKRRIVPHLPELFERYPELGLDLDLTERLHDPVPARTDLVIRIGAISDSALLATRLGTQRSLVVASPAYLARCGTPRTLDECAGHRLIDKRHPAAFMGWRTLLGESRGVRQRMTLQTDDLEAQAQACVAGLGLMHAPDWVFQRELLAGLLVELPLEPVRTRPEEEIVLLRNPGSATAAMQAVTRFLRTAIGGRAA